jgi:hypothetical protein
MFLALDRSIFGVDSVRRKLQGIPFNLVELQEAMRDDQYIGTRAPLGVVNEQQECYTYTEERVVLYGKSDEADD